MKQLITLIFAFFIFSCEEKKQTIKEGTARIVAVYIKPDSSRQLDILIREIGKNIKHDSSTNKDVITIDTLWGVPSYTKDTAYTVDSITGEKLFKTKVNYSVISKDSVIWKIQGVPIDSLLKKK